MAENAPLLPCPFCPSGDVGLSEHVYPSGQKVFGHICEGCGGQTSGNYTTVEYAVAAWNRRAPTQDAETIQALRDQIATKVEALTEARTQVQILQDRLGIKDTGCGTLSIIDAALSANVPNKTPSFTGDDCNV